MEQKPITNLFDALKQIFVDPKLLSLYGITFIFALILPFVMSFALRKWNDYKRLVLICNSKLIFLVRAIKMKANIASTQC